MSEAAAEAPRVLVADDEEDVRSLVGRILTDAGFAVELAEDGEATLASVERARPDLLVLDLMMPDVDGYTVLERLRARRDAPPVVILTARGDGASFDRGVVEGGAVGYLRKPFRVGELLRTCRRVLKLGQGEPRPLPSERRQSLRRPLLTAVTVLSRERKPLALGDLVDLGGGGAQVELGAPLETGSRVFVAFQTGGVNLTLECRVQWWQGSGSNRFVHGLSFAALSPEQEGPLRALLVPRR